MKKNSRKYRKIQKARHQKKNAHLNLRKCICQEVNDMNIECLAMAHIVTNNPIVMDSMETKKDYLRKLNSYIKAGGWNRRKFESAELEAYEKIIMGSSELGELHDISFYKYYILFDLMHILAYEFKPSDLEKLEKVKEQYINDFDRFVDYSIVNKIFKMASNPSKKVKQLLNLPKLEKEREYIRLVQKNILFKKIEPTGILVTATMSAGKSTFINALTGKYVCLSQNMACTSKIHCIVNKTFEDGFSAEYDHDLILTAGREELLNDNELNLSNEIVVSTSFIGGLSNQRIIVNDSPGVNYSGDKEHKKMTDRLIERKNYNLLIYVMNATQLATNDESEHLDYVKKMIGKTPIIFVVNKVDSFNFEEEDIETIIQKQVKMLTQKGFKNPVVCPVSSRAGYLAKQYNESKFSRVEEREFYNYIDKFEQMKLSDYYTKTFKNIKVEDTECEEKQLLKTSGLAYVEKIIAAMCKGGNKNDSGTR